MSSHDEMTCVQRTEIIRELNDGLRRTGQGGRICLTRAVAALPPETISRLMVAVQQFDAFTSGNDPYGERDFGKVEIDGEGYFWKVDYYDNSLEYGSPDPADEALTTRVLTVMHIFEY